MDQIRWAEREVAIAKQKLDPKDTYEAMCYDAALEMYGVFCAQGHSGMSSQLTIDILKKLLDCKPLTPIIEENYFEEEFTQKDCKGEVRIFQNTRKSSLFKSIDKDGAVTYDDIERFQFVDTDGVTWHNGLVDKICSEYYPIVFPYIPKQYIVRGETFLVDPTKGDYDTIGIFTIRDGNEVYKIGRYFAEDDDGEFKEIDINEYVSRYYRRIIKEET